ncbi:MAG: hypothetical protein Q9221_000596 [Calogaya cf. arnoldii]
MSSAPAVDDDYFNDLSRQPSLPDSATHNLQTANSQAPQADESDLPKPKRVACAICRKRKLKCDGGRPKCATCARLGHDCAYDQLRRKSGPKRGYVKELEARLAQVETQLKTKTQEPTPSTPAQSQDQYTYTPPSDNAFPTVAAEANPTPTPLAMPASTHDFFNDMDLSTGGPTAPDLLPDFPDLNQASTFDDGMTWDMIGLGLEEALPTQEAIDELHDIYFQQVHPSMAMLHPYRYRASMGLAPHMRPPVCLRYAMWCLAAKLSDRYFNHQDVFYRRARRYAENDEMKGLGEACVSVAHCQTWVLICTYEFQMMFFPRAWSSVGKAVRLAMMMGLNRVDGMGLDVKQVLPPPRDWIESEERRRTFWMAYCVDRYASMGTGWPVAVDERDVKSNLPANEQNYEQSIEQKSVPLTGNITLEGASNLSPFAGIVFMAVSMFRATLPHIQFTTDLRKLFSKSKAFCKPLWWPSTDDKDDDLQGDFWKRHRALDNTLLHTSLSLPPHLRLPAGIRDANIVFINMSIHTSTICLHQAAIYKADQNKLPQNVIDQSSTRCLLAATEIANIMRLICHLDARGNNPFMAFCLYVASRVFIHVLKKNPNETEIRSSLEFLLLAMQQFRKVNPLSESFLIQLGLDSQGTGIDFLLQNPWHSTSQSWSSMPTQAKLEVIVSFPQYGTIWAEYVLTHTKSVYESSVGCSRFPESLRKSNNYMHPMYPSLEHARPSSGSPMGTANDPQSLPIRTTQYSMHNFEWRKSLPRPSPNPEFGNFHGPTPAFLSGQEPSTNGPNGKAMGASDQRTNQYESDLSSGQNSSGPSPENSSSNTSYSPPSQNEDQPETVQMLAKCFSFVNGDGNFLTPPSQQQQPVSCDSGMQSNWNPEAASATPKGDSTGLTPGPDGDWSQVLDNMAWDSTLINADTPQWNS